MTTRTQVTRTAWPLFLNSRQGIVVLLHTYLVTFSLLLLTAALLTRTSIELQHAGFSVSQYQALWEAEGALDEALYGLRANTPVLTPNQCTSPTQSTLPAVSGRSSTYQICLTPNREYQIIVTGGSQRAVERLTAFAEIPSQNLRFRNALLAIDKLELRKADFGSLASVLSVMGGNRGEDRPPQWSIRHRGHVAILARNQLGPAVEILESSIFKGDIFLPVGLDKKTAVVVGDVSDFENAEGTDQAKELTEQIVLPTSYEPPQNATNLGNISLQGTTLMLPQGTYKANDLSMASKGNVIPVLATSGPVDLYVTGEVHQVKGELYGQPEGYSSPLNLYSPQHLRIFVTSDRQVELNHGLSAAVLYAPKSRVCIGRDHLFLGAVVAKEAKIGERAASARAEVLYDEALSNVGLVVNTVTPEVVLRSYSVTRSQDTVSPSLRTTKGTIEWSAVPTSGTIR